MATGAGFDPEQIALDAVNNSTAFVGQLYELGKPLNIPEITYDGRVPLLHSFLGELLGSIGTNRPGSGVINRGIPTDVPPDPAIDTNFTIPGAGVAIPDFGGVAPVLNLPVSPVYVAPLDPGDAPLLVNPDPVIKPTYTLPDVPVLTPTMLAEKPTIEYPTFDAVMPVDDLVVPSNNFNFSEEDYNSELLTALKAKLLNDLENGGYGIEPNDEADLMARARDRSMKEMKSRIAEIRDLGASSGMPMPTGAHYQAEMMAYDKAMDELADMNKEIMLKRADMYVQNRQFTITSSIDLERALIQFHGTVMERALNLQKSILEAQITVFNAQVNRYNARLDAYKSQVSAFEVRLRAVLNKIEVYKAEIEANQAINEENRLRVQTYTAMVDATRAVMDIYKTEAQVASILADIEKTKMDGYRAKVEAFGEKVRAEIAKFDAYKAQISGELAKVDVFKAEVDAYQASTDAKKTLLEADSLRLSGEVKAAEAKIEVFKAQVSSYEARLRAAVALIEGDVSVYNANVNAWAQEMRGYLEAYGTSADVEKANIMALTEVERLKIEAMKANVDNLLQSIQLRVGAASAGSEVYKALAAGAVSAISSITASIASS